MPEASRPPRIGVLALQGGFHAHVEAFRGLGVDVSEVRTVDDLAGIGGLVIPGGESTTITMGIESAGLAGPLRESAGSGRPVFGTCAGMIVCDTDHLGLLDITTERNGYGRQAQSFEADVSIDGVGAEPFHAVFIRAPLVSSVGSGVEILASHREDPVVVLGGDVLACSFHPELTQDLRLHKYFIAMVTGARKRELGDNNLVQESEATA